MLSSQLYNYRKMLLILFLLSVGILVQIDQQFGLNSGSRCSNFFAVPHFWTLLMRLNSLLHCEAVIPQVHYSGTDYSTLCLLRSIATFQSPPLFSAFDCSEVPINENFKFPLAEITMTLNEKRKKEKKWRLVSNMIIIKYPHHCVCSYSTDSNLTYCVLLIQNFLLALVLPDFKKQKY